MYVLPKKKNVASLLRNQPQDYKGNIYESMKEITSYQGALVNDKLPDP